MWCSLLIITVIIQGGHHLKCSLHYPEAVLELSLPYRNSCQGGGPIKIFLY